MFELSLKPTRLELQKIATHQPVDRKFQQLIERLFVLSIRISNHNSLQLIIIKTGTLTLRLINHLNKKRRFWRY